MNGGAPLSDALICGRCSTACETGDRFCRQCGMPLEEERLPAVREERLPTEWRPSVPAAVAGGAALVAAGTVGRFVLGRLVRGAFNAASSGKPVPVSEALEVLPSAAPDGGVDLVTETFFFRRVSIRR